MNNNLHAYWCRWVSRRPVQWNSDAGVCPRSVVARRRASLPDDYHATTRAFPGGRQLHPDARRTWWSSTSASFSAAPLSNPHGRHQCRHKPKWAPFPELQQLALDSGDLFSRHTLLNNGPLYVALSSLIVPLRQPIRPFTTDKALSGPLLHRDRVLFPRAPPGAMSTFNYRWASGGRCPKQVSSETAKGVWKRESNCVFLSYNYIRKVPSPSACRNAASAWKGRGLKHYELPDTDERPVTSAAKLFWLLCKTNLHAKMQ